VKILQLIDTLHLGGAERMAVNIACVLSEENLENVLVVTRDSGPLAEFLPTNTIYLQLQKKSSFDFVSFYKLLNFVKKVKPTVLHAHSTSIYWGVLIKLFYPSLKLIWHDHYGLSEYLKDNSRLLIKLLSGNLNGIIVVNDILFKWSIRNIKIKNILFLRNFPYLNNLNLSNKNKYFVILHLANLRPQKDHLTLIEAVRILKTKINDPFQLICAGNDLNDDYSIALKHKVKAYNLENIITFTGAVKNVASLLEQASLGVLSSQSEGLPVSLLEYGLAALPVVVTDVGQCAEVVGNGKYGLVVPPSNPEKLAASIEWHLINRQSSMEMGQSFRKQVEDEYGSMRFLRDYTQFIHSL
jgi:glycosyltransferase involved in cell wall biosynthesis